MYFEEPIWEHGNSDFLTRFKKQHVSSALSDWLEKYIIPSNSQDVILTFLQEPGGIGDAIALLPAFRHFVRLNPNVNLVLCTYSNNHEIYKYCRYIHAHLPFDFMGNKLCRFPNVKMIDGNESMEQHHRDHIVRSNVKHVCQISELSDDVNLDYELDIREDDFPKIQEFQKELKDAARGKRIVGISPAFTMFSRIWQTSYWEQLTTYLQKDDAFVVSMGIPDDLYIKNIDFDARGRYSIRFIPHILDVFESIFVVNSGMMHISGINQDVKIILISVGQWPAEIVIPFRRGKLGHNSIIVEHNCPIAKQCFENHITDRSITKQTMDFLKKWKLETRNDFPEEEAGLLRKYICWNYCDKESDKFECSRSITPEQVFEAYKL